MPIPLRPVDPTPVPALFSHAPPPREDRIDRRLTGFDVVKQIQRAMSAWPVFLRRLNLHTTTAYTGTFCRPPRERSNPPRVVAAPERRRGYGNRLDSTR